MRRLGCLVATIFVAALAAEAQYPPGPAPEPFSALTPARAQANPALEGLVAAERSFARMSEENGMREAFLANLAEDAVLFRPRPVPGLAWMRERPAPTGALLWRPDYAELSDAGDLGVTAGPWEYRPPAESKQPSEHGHFVTVWRHRQGTGWKVAVDIGVSHPPDPGAKDEVASPQPRSPASVRKDAVHADIDGSLRAAEDELERSVASKGFADALLDRAAYDLRVYREGSIPAVTRAAARTALAAETSRPTFKVEGSGFSRSGDLGYVYGVRYSEPGKEDAAFLRVWRRGPGKVWRVTLDLAMPIPTGSAS